jgi:hypothetical protein
VTKVERLRSRTPGGYTAEYVERVVRRRDELEAEVERLQAALREIADANGRRLSGPDCQGIARNALAEEKE